MRIGILTASRTNNNGTDLQAAAMQRLFSRTGAQVEIVDYACRMLEGGRKLFPLRGPSDIIRLPWKIFQNIAHEQFRKSSFTKSPETYDPETLRLDRYDAVVVGSDQIWNLKITGGDLNFFLPEHCGQMKRFSYAASLGRTDITDWEESYQLSKYLSAFEGISVREHSGVEALKAIGVTAREDLDPILCMKQHDWETLCPPAKHRKKYVLLYIVEKCPQAVADAKAYARRIGAQVIWVAGIHKPIAGVKTKSFVSLGKWLGLMNNAEMVFTNSYHGLSTAISLHTNFRLYSLGKQERNTRSVCLLEKLKLEEFSRIDKEGKWDATPDWMHTEQILEGLRSASQAYVQSIVEAAGEKQWNG